MQCLNLVHDPGPRLFGLELHHFDYDLLIFIKSTVIQLFLTKKSTWCLIINAFSLGWLIDEIPYIRFNTVEKGLDYYNSSLVPVLIIFTIVPLTIIFLRRKGQSEVREYSAAGHLSGRPVGSSRMSTIAMEGVKK